jgi:hypothetical protein
MSQESPCPASCVGKRSQSTSNHNQATIKLQSVDEIGADVAHHADLLGVFALEPVIPLSSFAQRVLATEQDVHEHGATEEAEEHVAKHGAVAGAVVRLLFGVVDVGGYDAVPGGFISMVKRRNLGCVDLHVSPSDDYANHDTTLVHAFDVIGGPCQRVRNGRVNSSGTEEGSGVLNVDVVGPEKHSEANTAHEGHGHVAVSTPASAIGEPSDEDGHGCGYGVGRHGHELRFGVFVAHAEENGWLLKVLANLSMMGENKRGAKPTKNSEKEYSGQRHPM